MPRVIMKLSIKIPERSDDYDVARYVVDAVRVWRGQLEPLGGYDDQSLGDPLWALDPDDMRFWVWNRILGKFVWIE